MWVCQKAKCRCMLILRGSGEEGEGKPTLGLSLRLQALINQPSQAVALTMGHISRSPKLLALLVSALRPQVSQSPWITYSPPVPWPLQLSFISVVTKTTAGYHLKNRNCCTIVLCSLVFCLSLCLRKHSGIIKWTGDMLQGQKTSVKKNNKVTPNRYNYFVRE